MIVIGVVILLVTIASVLGYLAPHVADWIDAVQQHRLAQANAVMFYAGLLGDEPAGESSDPRDTL